MSTSSAETLTAPTSRPSAEGEHGFERKEMYKEDLAGTVNHYEKHVFLCFGSADTWPSHVETSQAVELPRVLAASLKARKSETPKMTRLTICEAKDSCDGDVLIFPDMLKVKGLTPSDVESFVDEVLVKGNEYSSDRMEKLQGSHVFVCAHASRDMRCGVCGPALIETFNKEIIDRGLDVTVRSCSHIGGHKYAGNVVIYSPDVSGEITGHWYGYVTPNDAAAILDDHIGKGKIINKLWRGQMGLSQDDQKQAHQQRSDASKPNESCPCSQATGEANGELKATGGGCCQNKSRGLEGKKSGGGWWSQCSACFDSWETGDTLAALAVVGAMTAVALAFTLSRKSS